MGEMTIIQGTEAKLTFTIRDKPDGDPLDISAEGVEVTLRYMKEDGSGVTEADCSLVGDGTDGVVQTDDPIDFSGEDAPGRYLAELYVDWGEDPEDEKIMTQQFTFRVLGHLPDPVAP